MLSKRYQSLIQKATNVSKGHGPRGKETTHNLKLDGDDSEVQYLYGWPEQVVGFQCRQVHILKLAEHCTFATTLCNCHESEEATETCKHIVSCVACCKLCMV